MLVLFCSSFQPQRPVSPSPVGSPHLVYQCFDYHNLNIASNFAGNNMDWLPHLRLPADACRLFNNSLTGSLSPQLSLPEGLQTLELANNVGLTGTLPPSWALPSLQFAALWGCNFTGECSTTHEKEGQPRDRVVIGGGIPFDQT